MSISEIIEEHPYGSVPKNKGSVHLRMKLKAVFSEDFDLVSISNEKQIYVQKFNLVDTEITDDLGVTQNVR